jgi:hypothetical protein
MEQNMSLRKSPWLQSFSAFTLLSVLAGCAVPPPMGPTVVAMPAPGQPFSSFQHNDQACRYYAQQQVAGQGQGATQAANNSAAGGALLGAAVGALIGAAGGNAGAGAAIGGGSGLLLGAANGGAVAQNAASNIQAQYNIAYSQCMVGNGEQMAAPPPSYNSYTYPSPAYPPPGY